MSEGPEALHADERRLAAILAADVAGYSRLMGRNEEETVRDLEAHQAVILPLIAKHGGSVINIAGDGVVAQFPSAVRAVECAVAMQKIMAERNFDVPADRRMLLRIGVNLGDIIHDGTRTYGDGINVAARLEPLAEPGGICISAQVSRRRSSASSACPCATSAKNRSRAIAHPSTSTQIQPPDTRARPRLAGRGVFANIRRLAPALRLVAAPHCCRWNRRAGAFWPQETGRPEHTRVMAVLPFTNASGDPSLASLGPSLARVRDAFDLPDVPDGPALGPSVAGKRRTSGGVTRSTATS